MNESKRILVLAAFLTGAGAVPSSLSAPGDEYWDRRIGNPGINGEVHAIAVHQGDIYIAGQFTSAGGVAATNIARWDGDQWAEVGGGLLGRTPSYGLSLQSLGQDLYVGGWFAQAGEVVASNVARWDGQRWHALGEGLNSVVFALATDGPNVYAGGHFTVAGEVAANKVAKWDGQRWAALGEGVAHPEGYHYVRALAYAAPYLYTGGSFRTAGGIAATSIARWNGVEWSGMGGGVDGSVVGIAAVNKSVYVGGFFRRGDSVFSTNIIEWDGEGWRSLAGGLQELAPYPIYAIAADEENNIYVVGGPENIGGVSVNGIARWDGTTWHPLGSGVDSAGALVSTRSELIVGGTTTMAGGQPVNQIVAWQFPRKLKTQFRNSALEVSWPAADTNFLLEASGALSSTNWMPVDSAPALVQGRLTVTNEVASGNRFFRLREKTVP
jgi:hypothetical protein